MDAETAADLVGFNEWLAMLPLDDWGKSYENSIPVQWDADADRWRERDDITNRWVEC